MKAMQAGKGGSEVSGEAVRGMSGVVKDRRVVEGKKGGGEKESETPRGFEFAAVGLFVRRRKRDEDVDERIVVGHQAFRPTKRARRKSVLAGFQGLQLGDGSFKATFEDGFCEHRRKTRERVVRRIATVTGEQLKDLQIMPGKLSKLIRDQRRQGRDVTPNVDMFATQRKHDLLDHRRLVSQKALWSKLHTRRSTYPCMSRKKELITQLMELFREKDKKMNPTMREMLIKEYCCGSLTPDERHQLRNMYPYLREEYKKYHNLTDKEVLEREYVYDCYVYEEEDELVYEDGAPRSEYSEDSNSEGWYGNDYPDEEDEDSDAPQVPSSSEDYNDSEAEDNLSFR